MIRSLSRRMVFSALLAAFLTPTAACTGGHPPVDREQQAELMAWLDENSQSPTELVLSLFDDHDVVILGEQHKIKHQVLFVQSLLEPLRRRGVHTLATEFARREDQALLDDVVTGAEWDEAGAREIGFRQFVPWGFREYVDIYKAAWQCNQDRGSEEQVFRVLGMNGSPQWHLFETEADLENPDIRREVYSALNEDAWAQVVIDAVARGEKVLVYCGIHHGFSRYRQPIVKDGKFSHFDRSLRAGNYMREALGDRVATVYMHAWWSGPKGYGDKKTWPAGGVIDAVMRARDGGPQPVGFRLTGTPFGQIASDDNVYHHGYDDFRLEQFCDGWIYTKPLSQYEGVTPILDWITEENLERARRGTIKPRQRTRNAMQYNYSIAKDASGPSQWAKDSR